MASGRRTGRAARRDVLTRRHSLTVADEDAARADVGVAGVDAAAVVDLDEVAVAARPPRVDDRAAGGRVDGRRAAGRQVDRVVKRVRAVAAAADDLARAVVARDLAVGELRPPGSRDHAGAGTAATAATATRGRGSSG